MSTTLGHEAFGTGARKVFVLNDWIGDTSSWDSARPYLDVSTFTWVFTDLRGYGRSKALTGSFNVEESAADVLALADSLGVQRFTIVGHSMSTLIALHLAQHAPARIERAIAITPPPRTGFGADDDRIAAMQGLARGDDARRLSGLRYMLGDRQAEGFLRFKAQRWRDSADPEAVAAYVPMFARRGLPDPAARIEVPVLAITGELDSEPMRCAPVTASLAVICARLTVAPFEDCGHYPMQEMPPMLVAAVERFLGARGE